LDEGEKRSGMKLEGSRCTHGATERLVTGKLTAAKGEGGSADIWKGSTGKGGGSDLGRRGTGTRTAA